MKSAAIWTLGFLTLASQALADTAKTAPLVPGRAAGVRKAQLENGNGMFLVAGAALVGITVGLATAGSGPSSNGTGAKSGSSSSSSSTTGTTP